MSGASRDPVGDEPHARMIGALVDVIDYVTRAYALRWPTSGFAVHVSSYANYGSAYSSGLSNVIVVPSQSNLTADLYGLEAIVHEAMHQWDGQMFGALRAAAPNATVPRDLSHALGSRIAAVARRRERAEC